MEKKWLHFLKNPKYQLVIYTLNAFTVESLQAEKVKSYACIQWFHVTTLKFF